jgi:hypothetical protein
MDKTELSNLLNRAAAALETPNDLSVIDRRFLAEDLQVLAEQLSTESEAKKDSFSLQFNFHGDLRIVHNPSGETGEWADYRSIAVLKLNGRTFIAGSDYGLLPAETVFELSEALPTSIDDSQSWKNRVGKVMHKADCPCCIVGDCDFDAEKHG